MNRNFTHHLGSALCLLLLLIATDTRPCGQNSGTIIALPTLGGSESQINALNSAGQITGVSLTPGDLDVHALLYSAGVMTDLGAIGGTLAINASAQIVGEAADRSGREFHAFLYSNGALMDLGTLGGSYSSAVAINDAGQVAGNSLTTDGAFQAFRYENGSLMNLGTLGGYSAAIAINQSGNIAGNSITELSQLHGFLYANGTMIDLQTLGGDFSYAYSLNNSDMVVGESSLSNGDIRGFVYSGGVMTEIGTLGGSYSSAFALNNPGQVIGNATTANDEETHAFIYSSGRLTDLGTLGGSYSVSAALNNLGQVVGEAADTNGAVHAFIWQNGSMVDLNSILPENSGWELTSARFINDAGRVAGVGSYNGAFQSFIIDLGSANHSPVAVAGPDQNVDCQAQVTLDGSASSDPDGDTLSYEWRENGSVLGTNTTLTASFGAGTHTFTLKVTDPCGSSSQEDVVVHVADTTAPTVSCPGATTAATDANCQAVVPNLVSHTVASDNCTPAGSLTIVQNPPAGTLVGVGSYTIAVTATDASGNSGSCSAVFTVVDTTAPTVTCPGALTASTDANCQAVVPNLVSQTVASDNCTPAGALTIVQNPPAGTLVGVGTYTITITATDAAGNSGSCGVVLTVVDRTAPTVACPGALTAATDAHCRAVVPNLVSQTVASDNCTPAGALTIVQNPPAGTLVGVGSYTITVTATDASGNSGSCGAVLTVVDTTAPVISRSPEPVTLPVDANCQSTVPDLTRSVVASDNCTAAANLVVTQNPAAGTAVGRGQYSVTVTVADAAGNRTSTSVSLSVVDTTAPVIASAPSTLTVSTSANCQGAVPEVVSTIVASDNCTAANELVVSQNPTAGTLLPAGHYFITVTVKDASGNSTTRDIALTISDLTAPTLTTVSASPEVLSPPNNQLVPVTVTVTATDNCDPAPVSHIISITADDAVAAGDIQITGALTANLAASKNSSGETRVYTITFRCTDASGNSSTGSVNVIVPKNQSDKNQLLGAGRPS